MFKPSVFRLYYENRIDDAAHKKTLSHKCHMLIYLLLGRLRGEYKILYSVKSDEENKVVSYIAYAKSNDGIVQGTTIEDLYTIFIYTYPAYRGKGYASEMARFLLEYEKFEGIYKTIKRSNVPSIRVAEKNGYRQLGYAKKIGLLHRIIRCNEDTGIFLYCYKRQNKAIL